MRRAWMIECTCRRRTMQPNRKPNTGITTAPSAKPRGAAGKLASRKNWNMQA